LQPRRRGRFDHRLRIDALIRGWPRAAAARVVIDDAHPPLGPQRLRHISQQRDRIVNLAVRVGDQHRIEAGRKVRVRFAAEHRPHVAEVLPLRAPFDRIDHGWLDVLGVHEPVRADAACEPDGEPAARRANFGDDRAVGDVQRVHDLIRLLPLVAVGRFEKTEVERSEETRLRLEGRGSRSATCGER
jgi:hypothetical protein